MNQNIFLLVICTIFLQANCLSLTRHDIYSNSCFYLPLGETKTNSDFTYTITKAWTPEQAGQIKNGTLNVSDFIDVKGWKPYGTSNYFLREIGRQGTSSLRDLKFVKHIIQGSDAPQYGLSTSDLEFAFGHPSKASQYIVPPGKALVALRFQPSVKTNPFVGKWSVLIDLLD